MCVCVCVSPTVATYVGFLSDVWKDPPRVTVWLAVVGNVLKVIFFHLFWAPRALPLEKSEGFIIFRVQKQFQALPARQGPSEEPPRRSPLDGGRAGRLQKAPPSSGAERWGSKAFLVGQGPSEEPPRRSSLDRGLSGAPKGSPLDRGQTHQAAPVALPPASRQTHQPVQPPCRHVPFALHAIRT